MTCTVSYNNITEVGLSAFNMIFNIYKQNLVICPEIFGIREPFVRIVREDVKLLVSIPYICYRRVRKICAYLKYIYIYIYAILIDSENS